MNNFIIYPAIDLRNGKVVRLCQGKRDQQTIYDYSPEKVTEEWIEQGAEWLHVVNLNGAFGEDTEQNEGAIRKISMIGEGDVKIQLGGGIRTIDQISAALDIGVSRIVLGTAVIDNPSFGKEVLDKFGGKKIAFGFDALGQELMSRGWQSPSGTTMKTLACNLAKEGARFIIYTNIEKDGMQTGVDWESTKRLADETGLQVIASGGTATLEDVVRVRKVGLAGIIVGRALYEGNFTLKEAIDAC
jgi:phosphoribosylformimino-5-aminoimidazole carboxamide ribotide isomerase